MTQLRSWYNVVYSFYNLKKRKNASSYNLLHKLGLASAEGLHQNILAFGQMLFMPFGQTNILISFLIQIQVIFNCVRIFMW